MKLAILTHFPLNTSCIKGKKGTYIHSVPRDNIQLEQAETKGETERERQEIGFCFKESEEMLKDETIRRAGRRSDLWSEPSENLACVPSLPPSAWTVLLS